MKVKDMIAILQTYDPDMPAKVLTNDGNGHCHEQPSIERKENWILSTSTLDKWNYAIIDQPIVEIS